MLVVLNNFIKNLFIKKSSDLTSVVDSAQPFIWFSCFLYICIKNMEFLTSSHSAVSNTLFIWTSFEDHYFQSAYPAPQCPSQIRPDSLLRLWLCINHLLTYLLTYLLTRRRMAVEII